jgi:hypothetical protein
MTLKRASRRHRNRSQARTIYVTYRGYSRFGRIRLRRPGPQPPLSARITALYPAARVPERTTDYDADLAIELLASTCELPEGKRALMIIIGEYRHALHALATQAGNARQPAAG